MADPTKDPVAELVEAVEELLTTTAARHRPLCHVLICSGRNGSGGRCARDCDCGLYAAQDRARAAIRAVKEAK